MIIQAASQRILRQTIGVAVLIFGIAVSCSAEQLSIRTYTAADGLPRDQISTILQDSRGFIWFGTSEGVSRFDGYQFVNYGIKEGLPDRAVTSLLETREARTGSGLLLVSLIFGLETHHLLRVAFG